jgi:hypothetical protein
MCTQRLRQPRAMLVLASIAALGVGVVLTTSPAPAVEVVVVYTARHYGQEPVFEAFTKQTYTLEASSLLDLLLLLPIADRSLSAVA